MPAYDRITVVPISGAIGAEIGDVDVAAELDEATISEIRRALLEHLVIFFRDQALDVARHKAFTRRFGELFVHPNYQLGQEDTEMVYLLRRPGDESAAGEKWHADTTMMAVPPMGAILYALEVPEYGGDTLFANQYLAYETLSEGMKRLLAPLKAVHDDTRVAGPKAGVNARRSSKVREDDNWRPTENAHPIVRVHPETGRKHLFVNEVYVQRIAGMTEAESRPLLGYLYAHACRPEFTCRFRWQPGSIAFWDNRCSLHLAIHDRRDYTRHMQRTQIAG
ncbi:MAG: TauD/TfdA family dioxygenase [Alphaproteobacteria bacterium]|jgi:taurine dioxygenase|nr:TauD/TfdA family dioxygenase [Alphaproteobacteria bacterium]